MELNPRIRPILKMFEPTILPNERSAFFFIAAVIDAASSGSDVPQAMSVMDMK